jgi:tetratricopeptide (TPR) repeat protein
MSLDKLKDTARKHEQKEDWRKAIEVYLKAIQQVESGKDASNDLSLYNRVGDLYLKVNDTASAVKHYERAVDLYGDQGFFNNGIALCGKILRVNPGRTLTYLKLAQLHARKNVVIEAKRNLLEYIERMHGRGELDEAFTAVKAFADQFSSSQDIRLMLIELLRAASRSDEVREQLEKLSFDLEAIDGHAPAKPATHASDAPEGPDAADAPAPPRRGGDLIFLDTGFGEPSPTPGSGASRVGSQPAVEAAAPDGLLVTEPLQIDDPDSESEGSTRDLPLIDTGSHAEPSVDGIMRSLAADADAALAEGFEATAFDAGVEPEVTAPSSGGFDGYVIDEAFRTGDVLPADDAVQLEPVDDLGLAGDSALADEPLPLVDSEPLIAPEPEVDLSDMLNESLAEPELEPVVELPETDAIELEFVDDGGAGGASARSLGDTEAQSERTLDFLHADSSIDEPAASLDALATASAEFASSAPHDELEALQQAVIDQPDNPATHMALGNLLVQRGETAEALFEFRIAAEVYEGQEAWEPAGGAIDQIIALEPDDIRHYQKLVELGFRSGSRNQLIDAYLRLADVLARLGADDKAHAVYNRVLDHDPTNPRALAGISAGQAPVAEPAPTSASPATPARSAAAAPKGSERARGAESAPPAAAAAPPSAPAPAAAATHGNSFVDLGSLVLDEQAPKDTRMRVEGRQPIEDEQRAFEETLAEFKRGIEQNLAADDYQAHYDLGVAFKEMGLLDEAIAEFQKALRAPEGRLRTSEALGIAFFEKGQFAIAETVLRRAVDGLEGGDDEKIGLLYWLGRAAEEQGKSVEALRSYERALAVDIRFMDTSDRIQRLTAGRS